MVRVETELTELTEFQVVVRFESKRKNEENKRDSNNQGYPEYDTESSP
jgi:hypothetical protein